MEYKVIVTVNSNNDKITASERYDRLFAKAYQALEKYDASLLKVTYDDKMFHSIDEYFAHLSYLYALDPVYIMLPLDETAFTVDANKRTITNPKITVLQKDQNAEIVTFVIDRYFDYKDLDTAQYTFVQWTLPDGTEGASNITLKDLSIRGKLRLGWPLDNEITSQKGTVKFSLRFFDTDTVVENGETKTVVVYSFNTLTSTLNITESLQPEVDPNGTNVNDPVNEGLFKKAIINSQLYTENMAIPIGPRFDDPGLNLIRYESLSNKLDEDTGDIAVDSDGDPIMTLTLEAQAIVTDSGSLNYEWWYKPAQDYTAANGDEFNSSTWYCYDPVVKDDVSLPGFSSYGGATGYKYEEVTLDSNGNGVIGEKYFKDKNGTAATAEDFVPNAVLYERFATYTVPEDKNVPVTGQYKVVATNTIGTNTTKSQDSTVCFLVSPEDVTFVKGGDLNATEIFDVDSDGNDLAKTLTVKPSDDSTLNVVRTYTWSRYVEEPEVVDNVLLTSPVEQVTKPSMDEENVEGRKHTITEPGWYQVVVNSSLNRETKSATSTMCKVTSYPVVPAKVDDDATTTQILTMAYGKNASAVVDSEGFAVYNASENATVVLDLTTALSAPKDAAGNQLDDSLFSEGLSYSWGYSTADVPFRYLTPNDVGDDKLVVSGLGTPELTVRCVENDKIYIYRCVVTNSLNGKTAACEPGDALVYKVM